MARAGVAFLPAREGGKMKAKGKHATDLGQETTTPMGTVGLMVETTTRDEQEGDPQHPGGTHQAMRRCLPGIGGEKGKK